MPDDMMRVICDAAVKNYPNESCGVIVQSGKKSLTVECTNIAEQRQSNFMISPRDYARAAEIGEIVGVWHTHVEIPPTPSAADKSGCEKTRLPWYIVAVRKRGEKFEFEGPVVIHPTGFEMLYIGRPYVPCVFDCYTLVQDYYKREYDIELSNYPYILEDESPGHTALVNHYVREGFVRIHDETPIAGDVFMMQINTPLPSHLGLYLGDGVFMHHQHGRLSRKDVYGGYWAKHTTHHLRHKRLTK